MKSLMFFVTSLKMGGSEKACVRMANRLSESFDVTVYTLFGGGELEDELSPLVKRKSVFSRFIRGVARVSSMLSPVLCHKLFIRGKYDIETAVGDGLESHVISGGNCKDKYSWVHLDVRFHGDNKSQKTDKRFSTFKKIICVSETAKKGFAEKFGFEDKIEVAYTPVDSEGIVEKSNGDSVNITFSENDYCITVGRLEQVKGFSHLISAVKAVEKSKLVIVGDGSLYGELTSLASSLGISERVYFTGQLSNPYPLVKNAKAYICSSLNESFGFAPLEAMMLGVPVISVKCGGVDEILNKENFGCLCENSIDGLTDALQRLEDGRLSFDIDGAKKRSADFSSEKCLERFVQIITK